MANGMMEKKTCACEHWGKNGWEGVQCLATSSRINTIQYISPSHTPSVKCIWCFSMIWRGLSHGFSVKFIWDFSLKVWLATQSKSYINIIFRRFIILQKSALRQAQFGVPWDLQFYRDFEFMDFRLDTAFYRCQKATFQFYTCKVVGPKVPPQPKGGSYIHIFLCIHIFTYIYIP